VGLITSIGLKELAFCDQYVFFFMSLAKETNFSRCWIEKSASMKSGQETRPRGTEYPKEFEDLYVFGANPASEPSFAEEDQNISDLPSLRRRSKSETMDRNETSDVLEDDSEASPGEVKATLKQDAVELDRKYRERGLDLTERKEDHVLDLSKR
jgi:hypothetical protein